MLHAYILYNLNFSNTRCQSATLLTLETSLKLYAQSCDYILTLTWRGKTHHPLFGDWKVLICKTLSPLHSSMLYGKFGWNWPNGPEEEDFLTWEMYFRYFVIICSWKKMWPFIWTNLILLPRTMHCSRFDRNWPSGTWSFLNFVNVSPTPPNTPPF